MLIQPSLFGALLGVAVGSIFFTYICGWDEDIKRLMYRKPAISKRIKLSLATTTFITTIFLFACISEILSYIWMQSSEISNKIAILRAVSNFGLSAVIGSTTIYTARQQYMLAKNNAIQEDIKGLLNRSSK